VDWTEIVKYLGGSTVLLAAVSYIAKSLTSQFLKRDLQHAQGEIERKNQLELQEFKGAQERELQTLRETQESKMEQLRQLHESTLQSIQIQANERVEHVKSALQRVERLQSDLLKSRDDAYGDIWKLTGAVNLFSTPLPVDCAALSTSLTNWYYAKGWLLTSESKARYFLLQETLNLLALRSVSLNRPSDEVLFGGDTRTVDVLRRLRSEQLQVAPRGDDGHYPIEELAACVNCCKIRLSHGNNGQVSREFGWLALQFVMSAFRSRLTLELGSRDMIQSSAAVEEHRVERPMHACNSDQSGGSAVDSTAK